MDQDVKGFLNENGALMVNQEKYERCFFRRFSTFINFVVVVFENKPVVLTESEYALHLSKALYKKLFNTIILYKMNC